MKNNFTNKIYELQNFNLEPSNEVWVEIEKKLPQEKKRRIVAWWWGVPVILGLGLITWLLSSNDKKEHFLTKKEDNTSVLSPKTEKNKENDKIEIVKNTPNFVKNSSIIYENTHISAKNTSIFVQNSSILEANDNISAKNTPTFVQNSSILDENANISTENTSKFVKNSSILDKNANISAKNTSKFVKNSSIIDKNDNISAKDTPTLGVNNKKIIDGVSQKKTKIIPRLNYPKKIDWSLAFGGGINYLSKNSLFNKVEEKVYTANLITGTVSQPQQNNNLSLPNTGFNFSFGVNGNYSFSKKSSLQFGLAYNYLQNNIGINSNIDSTGDMNATYSVGNLITYKNNYHLIGIPICYKHCFNPNSKNKISFFFGGTLEYALSKKWLYKNDEKSYYENNNAELNSVFVSLNSGLSFSLNNKCSIDIIAKKYVSSTQQSSSKYYWQQINMQVNIPLKLKK